MNELKTNLFLDTFDIPRINSMGALITPELSHRRSRPRAERVPPKWTNFARTPPVQVRIRGAKCDYEEQRARHKLCFNHYALTSTTSLRMRLEK